MSRLFTPLSPAKHGHHRYGPDSGEHPRRSSSAPQHRHSRGPADSAQARCTPATRPRLILFSR